MSEEPEPVYPCPAELPPYSLDARRRAIGQALRSRQPPPLPLTADLYDDLEALAGQKTMRTVRVGDRRTSLRLDIPTWEALILVAGLQRVSLPVLLNRIEALRAPESCGLTGAVRCYLLLYLRQRLDL